MTNSVRRQAVFLFVFFCVSAGHGQKPWEKPYQEWDATEVFRVLNDSPWAQTAFETEHTATGLPAASYSVTVRLRSALPIRRALVRQRQLAVNYDKLSSADKKRFDAETREFLECSDCANYYLVTVTSYKPGPSEYVNAPWAQRTYGVDIAEPLRKSTLKDLQPYVRLSNDRGEKRTLAGYLPPTATSYTAMFIFSRLDDQGDPLITRTHKKLHFEIDRKVFSKLATPLNKFSFDVNRLVQGDVIAF